MDIDYLLQIREKHEDRRIQELASWIVQLQYEVDFEYEKPKPTELRDYFAAAALQGLLMSNAVKVGVGEGYSILAYQQADAMLAEREK